MAVFIYMVEMQQSCIYIFMACSQQCCVTEPSPEITVGELEECRVASVVRCVYVCECVCMVCASVCLSVQVA